MINLSQSVSTNFAAIDGLNQSGGRADRAGVGGWQDQNRGFERDLRRAQPQRASQQDWDRDRRIEERDRDQERNRVHDSDRAQERDRFEQDGNSMPDRDGKHLPDKASLSAQSGDGSARDDANSEGDGDESSLAKGAEKSFTTSGPLERVANGTSADGLMSIAALIADAGLGKSGVGGAANQGAVTGGATNDKSAGVAPGLGSIKASAQLTDNLGKGKEAIGAGGAGQATITSQALRNAARTGVSQLQEGTGPNAMGQARADAQAAALKATLDGAGGAGGGTSPGEGSKGFGGNETIHKAAAYPLGALDPTQTAKSLPTAQSGQAHKLGGAPLDPAALNSAQSAQAFSANSEGKGGAVTASGLGASAANSGSNSAAAGAIAGAASSAEGKSPMSVGSGVGPGAGEGGGESTDFGSAEYEAQFGGKEDGKNGDKSASALRGGGGGLGAGNGASSEAALQRIAENKNAYQQGKVAQDGALAGLEERIAARAAQMQHIAGAAASQTGGGAASNGVSSGLIASGGFAGVGSGLGFGSGAASPAGSASLNLGASAHGGTAMHSLHSMVTSDNGGAAGQSQSSAPFAFSLSSSSSPAASASSGGAAGDAAQKFDFEALVDRLAEAREAARSTRAEMALSHEEFGRVTMRVDAASGLKVTLSSADPEFAETAKAALAEQNDGSGRGQDGGRDGGEGGQNASHHSAANTQGAPSDRILHKNNPDQSNHLGQDNAADSDGSQLKDDGLGNIGQQAENTAMGIPGSGTEDMEEMRPRLIGGQSRSRGHLA